MMMPGCALSTPPCQEPSTDTGRPSTSSKVLSPKYQTFPSLSCANQSSVSSVTSPPTDTVSCTSTQVTPRIVFVLCVTANSTCSPPPSEMNVVPGTRGKNGLSMTETKFVGSMTGS